MTWLVEGLVANWLAGLGLEGLNRLFPQKDAGVEKIFLSACQQADIDFDAGLGDAISTAVNSAEDREKLATLFVLAARTNLTDDLTSETIRLLSGKIDFDFAGTNAGSFLRHLAWSVDSLARSAATSPDSPLFNWYSIVTDQAALHVGALGHGRTLSAIEALHAQIESLRTELQPAPSQAQFSATEPTQIAETPQQGGSANSLDLVEIKSGLYKALSRVSVAVCDQLADSLVVNRVAEVDLSFVLKRSVAALTLLSEALFRLDQAGDRLEVMTCAEDALNHLERDLSFSGYCILCKQSALMENVRPKLTKRGGIMMGGDCELCGNRIFAMTTRQAAIDHLET